MSDVFFWRGYVGRLRRPVEVLILSPSLPRGGELRPSGFFALLGRHGAIIATPPLAALLHPWGLLASERLYVGRLRRPLVVSFYLQASLAAANYALRATSHCSVDMELSLPRRRWRLLSFVLSCVLKTAGGGEVVVAPCRAGEAKSPQGAFAAREGLEIWPVVPVGVGDVRHHSWICSPAFITRRRNSSSNFVVR